MAEAIHKVVKIPVIGGTRINHPSLANKIIEEGRVDMVYIARALIADPEWPNKAKEGRVEDIRPCTTCLLCFDKVLVPEPIACSVNPRAGREGEYKILPAEKAKKVVIIGAGPAGLEAANIAAMRGHKVVMYEQKGRIGGQLVNVAQVPYRKSFRRLIRYYETQLRAKGVEIKLRQKADVERVLSEKPDEVIVAIGAEHVMPEIEGITGGNVCTAVEALSSAKALGEKVVIMGGGMVGCQVAEFLLWKGKRVSILDEGDKIGRDINRPNRWVVLQRLKDAGAEMITGIKFVKINSQGVTVLRDGVMQLYHDDIYFENWTGGHVKGKEALRKAWTPWFTNHGGFRFIGEDTFIDEQEQKILYQEFRQSLAIEIEEQRKAAFIRRLIHGHAATGEFHPAPGERQ